MPESHPIALSFEVTEARGDPSAANRVTVTSVERHGSVIHVNYDVVPPPDLGSHRARGEAKDDLGNDYCDLGGYFGITGSIDNSDRANTRAHGRLEMPLPPLAATMLRIRIRWEASGVIRMPWDASPHRSGTDQPTKSASRFRIDRNGGVSRPDLSLLVCANRTGTTVVAPS